MGNVSEEAAAGIPKITSLAKQLRDVQEKLSDIRSQEKELASQQEGLSNAIVEELRVMGNDDEQMAGIILENIGVLKLTTKPYPRVIDIDKFVAWGKDVNQMLPPLTVNPTTLSAWYNEQNKINLPLPPEDILPVFWKTTAKINKRS